VQGRQDAEAAKVAVADVFGHVMGRLQTGAKA
jgi:hypothetical protein